MKSIASYAFNTRSKKFKDVYYTGTQSQWKAISISSSGNSDLTNATIHYSSPVIFTSPAKSATGVTYFVNLANVPTASTVVVALYKDDKFVGFEKATYNGDKLLIETTIPHTSAKIMAWSDLLTMKPLAPATKIG